MSYTLINHTLTSKIHTFVVFSERQALIIKRTLQSEYESDTIPHIGLYDCNIGWITIHILSKKHLLFGIIP